MSREYIAAHLARFDGGIGRVSRREPFENRGTLGGPEAFVLPAEELEAILRETGGNVAEIERRLGFDPGDLGENPVFGVFQRDSVGDLRLSAGNEGGANANWIPGGITSGGVSEAILDLSTNTSFRLL